MPPPLPPLDNGRAIAQRDNKDMLACIAQMMLCLFGGGWAGYTADPESAATLLTGAIGLLVAWVAAYSAAHFVSMLFAPALITRDVVLWLRGRYVRNARDERRLDAVMVTIAVAVLIAVSAVVAVVVSVVAAQASLLVTLASFILAAGLASLLTARAHRAIGDIQWGGPPP
ncbi:MAG: hypothetical protein ACREPE_15565 [Lysobacter sp.]